MGCFIGCTSTVRSYFTGKGKDGDGNEISVESHLTNFFKNWKARDALVKFGASVSDIAHYVISQSNAPEDLKKGVRSTAVAFKDARVVFGLFNVLEGTAPHIFQRCVSISKLFRKITGKELDASDKTTTSEKILNLVSQVFDLIGSAAFAVAFGICRPIIFASKHFSARISPIALKVAHQFVTIMLINHISTFLKGMIDVANGALAYIREKAEGNAKALSNFTKKAIKNILVFLEKGAEIAVSTINVFKLRAPALVSLCLTLFAATLGLYKAWQDTAI